MFGKAQFRSAFKNILDLAFPPKCELCGQIDPESTYPFLCKLCHNDFKSIDEAICSICGTPFLTSFASSNACETCFEDKPFFDESRSAGIYETKLKDAIKLYKYQKKRHFYKPLSKFVLKNLALYLENLNFDSIISVPMSSKRLRTRGFDHAYLLAREIGEYTNTNVDFQNLYKNRETEAQVELAYKDRKPNIKDSFSMKYPSKLVGKNVLLVDDVQTSGATLNECAKVLKKEGKAKQVYCVTVARTISDYRFKITD